MKHTPFILLFLLGLISTMALTVNETHSTQANSYPSGIDADCKNSTARKGKHIQQFAGLVAPSKKIKRQIIKIPSTVSQVKIVRPPLNLRYNRAPQKFTRHPPDFRSGAPWMTSKPHTDYGFEVDNSFLYDPKKVKRNLKKPLMKGVSREEFYRGEVEDEFEEENQTPKKVKKHRSVIKIKRNKPKQNILREYLSNYEEDVRSNHEEGGVAHYSKVRYVGTEESYPLNGYDAAESSIHTKQMLSPNPFSQNNPESSMDTSPAQFYHNGNYVPALQIKNLATKGRQIQSMFSQQYTTHNPHVTTNFGLGDTFQPKGLQYGMKVSFADTTPHKMPYVGKYIQPTADASDVVVTAQPAMYPGPGIQVIQPPQFRDVGVSHPSHSSKLVSQQEETSTSQKATIRDILDKDCPVYDMKGFCDSPPRYPTQQIKNMVKRCADLMDAMNTQPLEEFSEMQSFDRRIDNHIDRNNKSTSVNLGLDIAFSWSRSATEEFNACNSDVELIEPGYAKEVNSGKWFVIVQHPETAIQRIATDTCRNPGKHCGGLSELKCIKINSLPGKSTRCVQRHTNQRLISWDPESPEECPRMRVFRFPSACTCHLDII